MCWDMTEWNQYKTSQATLDEQAALDEQAIHNKNRLLFLFHRGTWRNNNSQLYWIAWSKVTAIHYTCRSTKQIPRTILDLKKWSSQDSYVIFLEIPHKTQNSPHTTPFLDHVPYSILNFYLKRKLTNICLATILLMLKKFTHSIFWNFKFEFLYHQLCNKILKFGCY